jgi:hypothetical protein
VAAWIGGLRLQSEPSGCFPAHFPAASSSTARPWAALFPNAKKGAIDLESSGAPSMPPARPLRGHAASLDALGVERGDTAARMRFSSRAHRNRPSLSRKDGSADRAGAGASISRECGAQPGWLCRPAAVRGGLVLTATRSRLAWPLASGAVMAFTFCLY